MKYFETNIHYRVVMPLRVLFPPKGDWFEEALIEDVLLPAIFKVLDPLVTDQEIKSNSTHSNNWFHDCQFDFWTLKEVNINALENSIKEAGFKGDFEVMEVIFEEY